MFSFLPGSEPAARLLLAASLIGPVFALAVQSAVPGQAQAPRPELDPSVRPPVLLASGYTSASVHRFDPITGAPLGDLGFVPGAQSIRRGPDGNLYVCAEERDEVQRFDANGAFVDLFVFDDPSTVPDETGGLDGPTAACFSPTGELLVASFANDLILRYDGASGAYLGVFAQGAPLNGPDAGMKFGPDGNLWVPSFESSRVLRYDPSGASLGVFAGPASGLSRPRDILFRGGAVFVSSWGSDQILRFDRATGALLGVFASTVGPTGMAFGPHDGDLYVTSDQQSYVKVLDGETGALVSKPVGNNSGVLLGGTYLFFLQ